MHDVACEFAHAAVRSKDVQKQLARMSLNHQYTQAKINLLFIAPLQQQGLFLK